MIKTIFQEFRASRNNIISFIVAFLFFLTCVGLAEIYRYHYERISMFKIATAYAYQIQNSINHALSAVYPLSALIRAEHGKIDTFDTLSEELLTYYSCANSLQLAPNGIVTKIMPLSGNEKVIGHNLLTDLHRNQEAFLAKKTKQLTLAGPFELIQGGKGLAGRLPIFLSDENGFETFWGFSIVIIRVPEIFKAINLENLSTQNMAYRLVQIDINSNEEHVIVASKNKIIGNPIVVNIKVPNANWIFYVSPIDSWYDFKILFFGSIASLIFSLLLLICIMYFKKRKENLKLHFMAYHDSLTHLPNRVLLINRFDIVFSQCKHRNSLVAVCFIDLDHFKDVNDTYGHEVGDHILIEVTQRILKYIRAEDILSRQGGDEFILLLGSIVNRESVEEIIKRILIALSEPYTVNEHSAIFLSASIGIAFASDYIHDLDILIQQADSAMYEAKASGRNTFVYY